MFKILLNSHLDPFGRRYTRFSSMFIDEKKHHPTFSSGAAHVLASVICCSTVSKVTKRQMKILRSNAAGQLATSHQFTSATRCDSDWFGATHALFASLSLNIAQPSSLVQTHPKMSLVHLLRQYWYIWYPWWLNGNVSASVGPTEASGFFA